MARNGSQTQEGAPRWDARFRSGSDSERRGTVRRDRRRHNPNQALEKTSHAYGNEAGNKPHLQSSRGHEHSNYQHEAHQKDEKEESELCVVA